MSGPVSYAIFLLVKATPAWLRLSRDERSRLSAVHIGETLQKYPALRMRYFDAEAFNAQCSDVMMIETSDLVAYYDFIETLRDSPLLGEPYFEFTQIIPTIEDGFRAFEARNC